MRPSGFEPLTYRLEVVSDVLHWFHGLIFSGVFEVAIRMGSMFRMAVSTFCEYTEKSI